MQNNFLPQAVDIVKQAINHDNLGEYEKALGSYRRALDLFMTALKYEQNPMTRKTIIDRVDGYMKRAEEIKSVLETTGGPPPSKGGGAKTLDKNDPKNKDGKDDDENAKMRGALSSSIISEKPNVKWDDVAGLEMAKEALKEAVILPTRFPQLFTGKRKPWKGILLYGPPGTGKSFLAKAVATEADSTFFAMSSSDLVSKWQGESEKLVKQMFEMARESKPSIIFIDEIDSLCTARSEGESDSSRRIKTEFLVQMDGVGSTHGGVLVLGATNVPWELDPAMRRRFEKRVYIALPEASARSIMFKLNLGDTPNSLQERDYNLLGENSEGYSGSDVAVVVREALMEPLRKCQTAKQFMEDAEGNFQPCAQYPSCLSCPLALHSPLAGVVSAPPSINTRCTTCHAQRMTLYDVPGEKLQVPLISQADFLKALSKAHSSVGADELERFVTWTEEFGQEG
mmetsp:Transcript_14438/g.31821  ORF Transcript_14438/g.31821 Transcript_14438/m.31821 type:complete len:455 (-) Transcript_14438:205-1569(-)|eukprot:CAMPEP_0173199136 /NCGR_PEP_ID=MMETSP1141-20130122/17070_1 /TAXON_ID=483371 /ORGANISM="non described non described, Strain CCMP2298" /LENGTH=454 /DNA_ID=CAMNT_0014123997 /DNA_START=152 /DNA_END=1516 /DNA_ORIENTATION=-